MKKFFCFFILFSMLLASFPVSVKANGPYAETWVNESWGSSEDGDGDDEFYSIQAAVDNTLDNGIVHVAAGHYEWVEIDHPLTLEGAGRGQSYIEDEEVLIEIESSEVYVSGFTLNYCDSAVLIDNDETPQLYDVVISDCEMFDAYYAGVDITGVEDCRVVNCSIYGCGFSGVIFDWVEDGMVFNCSIHDCDIGVLFYDCNYSSIVNCEIYETSNIGIDFDEVDYCRIAGCHIHDNDVSVLLSLIPLSSHYTIICGCLIEDNDDGIVMLEGTDDIVIAGNTIRNNEGHGISVEDEACYQSRNWVVLNNIHGNGGCGVYVETDVIEPIHQAQISAGWNWWGDESGPYHDTLNDDGLGDEVTDHVGFESWLNVTITNGTAEWVEDDGVLDGLFEADAEVVYTNAMGWDSPIAIGVVGYADNPKEPFDGDIGKYIDVFYDYGDPPNEFEIRMYYTDADIAGFNESSLQMYWTTLHGEGEWLPCSDTGVVTELNIDQNQEEDYESCFSSGGGGIYINSPLGQEFVPQLSPLVGVEVRISTGTTTTVTVNIREDTIYGTILGSASRWLPQYYNGWCHFEFSTPLEVIPGNTYVIELTTDELNVHTTWIGCNLYPDGRLILEGGAEGVYDLFFRTYAAGSEPSGLAATYSGYVWATLNDTTTPILGDLRLGEGPFGIGGTLKPPEVWVDDDWEDTSPETIVDGHEFGTDAFDNIQDGVDAVADYGLVHVAPGEYDSVIIYDPVTLLGSGRDTEIYDDNVLIDIYCSDVYVSGFELDHCDVGVYAEPDSPDLYNITIANCYIYEADHACVEFVACQNSTVINCELSSDQEEAAAVAFGSCVNCAVEDCVIYWNGVGVFMDESEYCRVSGCWIVDNGIGVWLGEEPYSVYGCIISGCIIESNAEGVILSGNAAGCQIIGNTIRDNEGLWSGIHALDDAVINAALLNNIYGNIFGAYVEYESTGPPLLVGMLNWWGHESGPYHEYDNPGGEGDKITNHVYFEPWLSVMITNGTTEWVEGEGVLNGLNETDAAVDYYGAEGWESPACLSVVGYADNPGDPFNGDIGKYIDVIHSEGEFDELLILMFYTDADIAGFDESSLQMYYMSYMDENGWQPCSDTGVDANPYGFDDGEVDLDLFERGLIPPIVEDPLNDAEYAVDDIVRGYCVDDGEGFIFMMEMLTGPTFGPLYGIAIDSDQNPATGFYASSMHIGIDYIIALGDPPILLEWNGVDDFDYVKDLYGWPYSPEHLLFAELPFDDIVITPGDPIDIVFFTEEEFEDLAPNEGPITYTGPPYSGYIWAIINEETTPSIYDLTWMEGPFGARGDQKPTGPTEPVGGDIFSIDRLAILTPYLLMAIAIATATSILIKKRRH